MKFIFQLDDQIHCLFEVLDNNCCWIFHVVFLPAMNSCLCQKGCPSSSVCSTDICTRVIANHKKTQLLFIYPFAHFIFNEFECFKFWFTEIDVLKVKSHLFTMIFQNIIERTKSHSWPFIPTCPDDIILCSKIGRQRFALWFFNIKNVVNNFERSLIRTDIVHCKDGSNFINPLLKSIWKTTINSFLNVGLYLCCF